MVTDGQLALDLGHRPALGRDDFLVAPCNAEVVAWLERWPHWPSHALAIHGPAGSGKSHLLSAFVQFHGGHGVPVRLTLARSLTVSLVPSLVADAQVVAVDGLEDLADEQALFHLWNLTKETGRSLLLAGRLAPARMAVRLPDLASRLAATLAFGIGAPDDALLAALLIKHFADRQLRVSEDVVTHLLGRMERTFAAVGAVTHALDQVSLAERRPITIPLVRMVMERMAGKDDRQGELSWE